MTGIIGNAIPRFHRHTRESMLWPQTIKPLIVKLMLIYCRLQWDFFSLGTYSEQPGLSPFPCAIPSERHTPWTKVAALMPGVAKVPLTAAQQATIYF